MSKLDELIEGQTAHIKDPDLKAFYNGIYVDAYRSFHTGQKLLDNAHDKLAVLQGIGLCLDLIVEDLEEHGTENEELYDGHGAAYFKKERTAIKKRIAAFQKKGAKSDVFEKYQKGHEEYLDKAYVYSLAENTESTVGKFLKRLQTEKHPDLLALNAIDALAAAAMGGKKDEIESLLKVLTPEMLKSPSALYNLSACHAALGDKAKMIETIKKTQSKHEFATTEYLSDEPFKAYWKDTDFLAAIETKPQQ